MLSVDLKKGEKVDWLKGLSNYLKNQYSASAVDEYRDSINYVQKLRDDISNPQDKNEAMKELNNSYYAALVSIELRFPISENNIRVNFGWNDVFKAKKVCSYSIQFEKAAVLFNIGSLSTHLGCMQNRNTIDGLKTACQNFQTAAGVYTYLKEEIVERHIESFRQPNLVDMTPEFLQIIINLMLAQAQECFYEKAVKDNMKASIVSKLAAQVSDFYDAIGNLASNSTIQSSVPKHWVPTFQLKSAMFRAVANFRTAIVHTESDEYGMQVARLQLANKILEEAKKKNLKLVNNDVQQSFNTLQTQVTMALQKAEKENDTIYHDTVPNEAKLTSIEKKVIVKATNFTESFQPSNYKDPFVKLVPFTVTQKLSVYQDKKDTLVRADIRSIDEQNQIAIASLASMNLPGSIEAMETPADQLPAALIEKMKQVRTDGGARLILEYVETLNKIAAEDNKILESAIKKLDDEEKEDADLRTVNGSKWNRSPSHSLTIQLRQEAAKFKANIEHAKKSDGYVFKKFQDNQQFIVKLSSSVDDVKNSLPSSSTKKIQNTKVVQELKQSLANLDKVIADRNNIRNDITNLSSKDDITNRLLSTLSSPVTNDDELYSQELQKYHPLQEKLKANFGEQVNLLASIQKQNTEFEMAKGSNSVNAERENQLQQLSTAHKIFNELKNNLREGIQFYTNFQEILKQFASKCDDFVFARQTEKQELLQEIQRPPSVSHTATESPHGMYGPSYPSAPPATANQGPTYPPPTNQSFPPGAPSGAPWNPNIKPVYVNAPPPYPVPGQFPYGAQTFPPNQQYPPHMQHPYYQQQNQPYQQQQQQQQQQQPYQQQQQQQNYPYGYQQQQYPTQQPYNPNNKR